MTRIYISGPITGIEDKNRPAFEAETIRLRKLGYQVVNPLEVCEGEEDALTGADLWKHCMRKDIKAMMDCDALALLPGWLFSRGARIEWDLAVNLGMKIYLAHDLVESA